MKKENITGAKTFGVLAQIIHCGLILLFVTGFLYAGFQVFYVLQPEGQIGPMFSAASEAPFELMVLRRLYAIEGWLIGGVLLLYVKGNS